MKSILIVDDDPKIAAALQIRFRAGGYRTLHAGDAATAVSRAVAERPDLILLDISLPAGDGFGVARKLRGLPETSIIPIIFITASKDPGLRAKAMDLGAAGLFDKPYDADELLAVAGHALGDTASFVRPPGRPLPEEAATVAVGSTGSAKRVLIVEDDQKIAMALSVRLQSAGYEVEVAGDALSGVRAALKSPPDLALLDISVPAGNGFTVAERIMALPGKVPIMFLTASKQPGFRERARELGAVGYFEKPYEAGDLLAAVRQELGA
jgi:DNA-binding response OmpR family regulator